MPSPLEAVKYYSLQLPEMPFFDKEKIDSLKNDIFLQIQGEAVQVSENQPVAFLMVALDVAFRVCPEMVLTLNSGEKILVFDHWGKKVLRDKDIQPALPKNFSLKPLNNKFVQDQIIDLGKIWQTHSLEKNFLKAIKYSLEDFEKKISPSMITTLKGKAPSLLFLLAQYFLYGITGEIWYQENSKTLPIRIISEL